MRSFFRRLRWLTQRRRKGAELREELQFHMVLRQGMTPVMVGLAAGVFAALFAGRLIASLLFDIRADDPVTLATVVLVVAAVALVACFVPARRAMGIDPIVALRYE